MSKAVFLLCVLVCSFSAYAQEVTQGSLFAYGKNGKELGDCPLKRTVVKTEISGFLARVNVTQEFENAFPFPVEAVYTFPLSQNGAVDNMTMTVGGRVIHARIMKRDEARATYEQAKTEGKAAGLLDQERPNIFTQSVANIMPGDKVAIDISYVETLKYDDGAYEFVFPMTVGPRYIPGSVKDAAKISPPVAAARNGSDISIEVNLNAGVPVQEIRSTSHDIEQINFTPNTSKVTLKDEKTIPNKDFILRYDVSGGKIEDAVLAHRDGHGGFFTLILQPPDRFTSEDRTPKEIVFVLDTSGSMSGFPIEKAKEAMKMSIDGLYPDDTFNLITFSGDTAILFDQPVPATEANVERAKAFIDSREGSGGTEMMKAIKAALDPSDAKDHLRIVCFMTDGDVGNDDEIIAEIQRHPKARVFSFGIGSSTNRYLLDKMAEAGRGEAQYVSLDEDGSAAAKKFYERVRTPLLTDLAIDWNGLPVTDMYPSRLTDLFSAKPVIVHGRFTKSASGTIKLRGNVAGQPYERDIPVNLPESQTANDSLASLWARTRIDELSSDKLRADNSTKVADREKEITNLGLEFRLMTNFTSFVAVEDRVVNQNGKPVTIQVPVENPEGVDRDKVGAQTVVVDNAQEMVTVSGGIATRQVTNLGGGGGGGGRQEKNRMGRGDLADQSKKPIRPPNAHVSGLNNPKLTLPPPATQGNMKSLKRKGDPNSGFGGLSNGTGTGGGTGSGYGGGSGNGNGNGNGSGPPATISGGILNGKAISLPKPAYPAAASAMNASGSVQVQVTIDESGNVISATPVGGSALFQAAAVAVARQARFTPTMLSGKPVKVTGVITYNFAGPGSSSTVSTGEMKVEPPTNSVEVPPSPEAIHDRMLKEKLHTWLYSLISRLSTNSSTPTENEAKFVRDGKASINVRLSIKNAAVMEKLRAAGFEKITEKGPDISGTIPIERLAALAEIEEVKLVLPVL